jgi:hypothetical protein
VARNFLHQITLRKENPDDDVLVASGGDEDEVIKFATF